MKRLYGLQNDKENISLIVGDDKAMLIIQTAESLKARELNLELDRENKKEISADKVKPINISADKITTGTLDASKFSLVNLDGTGEKIKVIVGELRTQTNFLMSKVDYLETKLKEKDEEISKLKDLTNTKISSEEFWGFVKYHKDCEEIPAVKLKSYGFSSDYDGSNISSANKEKQPEPIQRALKRIEELKYITDVRIDEEFETTVVDDFPKNRLTITIDYLDVDFVKEMKKGD